MPFVDIVAVLSLIQYFIFSALVGRARTRYGVRAPAIVGNDIFERAYRVQMNTLELLVIFLPSLYMAERYWSPYYMAAIGTLYLIGRIVYYRAYIKDPASRSLGFGLSAFPTLVLLTLSLVGAVLTALK